MDQASKGEIALIAGSYQKAIECYTKALEQSPTAATYYIKRSTAYQRSAKYQDALSDASQATLLAVKRAKRELIAQAQLRRGIALFHLERYGDADFVFGIVKKLDDKEKSVGIWQIKTTSKLDTLPESDPKREITIKEQPDDISISALPSPSLASSLQPQAKPIAQTSADKIKHDWYQNNDRVYVSLLVKGVPEDKATIDITDNSISISFPLLTGTTYDFSIEPLFAPVVVLESTSKIMSTKVELSLKKQKPGQKWSALEGTSASTPIAVQTRIDETSASIPAAAEKGPAYPTSSRSGPKNWDKIASSYKKPAKAKEKEPGPDDDFVDSDEEGDPVNNMFKKIYKGASDDTRRAMMKSYQESNGTALSTDWTEVQKKKVETSPPDGMEVKSWEL